MDHGLSAFYRGRKVFVTGHTGFKGGWLVAILHRLGATIRGYAHLPHTSPALFNLIQGERLCDSVVGDIRDKARLAEAIHTFEPEVIFHLAAEPIVKRSYRDPMRVFDVNTMGTGYLLDILRGFDAPCHIVIVTTDKVYDQISSNHAFTERDPLGGGSDPYSTSKACAELVVGSFRYAFFNPSQYDRHQKAIATARAGNVIGGGDWAVDRIVPDFVRSVRRNAPVSIRNPNAIRPWQHVLEPLVGYLLLGMRLAADPIHFSGGFNFGPADPTPYTVEAVVQALVRCWGDGGYEVVSDGSGERESPWLMLDSTKAQETLMWSPIWDFETTIDRTVAWYKSSVSADITAQQIDDYLSEMANV